MRYAILIIFFLVSCDVIKKDDKKQDIVFSTKKNRYPIETSSSGLYMSNATIDGNSYEDTYFNLCFYNTTSSVQTKNHQYIAKKLQDDSLLPFQYLGSNNKKKPILFNDNQDESYLPVVYYEFSEINTINVGKGTSKIDRQVGKLYLLYENEKAGNYGIRLFVSDTTEKYGFFTVQTIISKHLHKNLPLQEKMMNEDAMIIKSSQNKNIEGIYAKIGLPYRIILDEEVKVKQHSSIILE